MAMLGMDATWPSLDATANDIVTAKDLHWVDRNFSEVLDLIEKKDLEGYFEKSLYEIILTLANHKRNEKSDIAQEKERYVIIRKLALLSEYWAELDFAAKNQEPNGLFSADELSYESKLAENLNIGTKIMFQFRGLSIMFEAADVSDGKIQLKLVKDHGKQIIPKKNLERIKIIVNKKPVQNGLEALSKVDDKMLERLFPLKEFRTEEISNTKFPLNWFNPKLNKEQKNAVKRICKGKNALPFIIFGPPGTGKSKTLCEAIKQTALSSDNLILVAAHSNVAVDLLVQDLIKWKESSLIGSGIDVRRIVSLSWYQSNNMSDQVKKYSTTEVSEIQDNVKTLRVVCGTLAIFGKFKTNKKFTHFFVDEAGQASEPDLLVPWTRLLKIDGCQVILAGDHQQLGPVVKSVQAQYLGLKKSMIERLIKNFDLYSRQPDNGKYNEKYVIQLTKNYRSHPKIIEMSNILFYDSTLEASADIKDTHQLCGSSILPNQDFPLLFQAVHSESACLPGSFSLYNMGEVEMVVEYVVKLLALKNEDGTQKLFNRNIGIVTPYKQQEKFIKNQLVKKGINSGSTIESKNPNDIEVGSVDKYQGNEKTVIIYSTVRSIKKQPVQKKFIRSKKDPGKKLDLLKDNFFFDYKRFNVAITRAKSLVVVIGDDKYLEKNDSGKTWKTVIEFVKDNGAFIELPK